MVSATLNHRISLKTLAEHLGLSPATVSFVLNDAPNRSIPEATRERVRTAAKEFGYRPNLIARSLQGMNSHTVGILLPDLGEGYHSQVLGGVGDVLMREGYFFFTAHHRHREDLVLEYPQMLDSRGAEGILAIDTHLKIVPRSPTIAIAGHVHLPGVTNITLNHYKAAELSLVHLYKLGHRHMAYIRGQDISSDSEARWKATLQVAKELGLRIDPKLVVKLERDISSPELGYPVVQQLLSQKLRFTAIVSFNDLSAIGTIRALHDVGLRVPEDVSVIGFDDVQAAGFHVPSLTTIRQPLRHMGSLGADLLLKSIRGERQPDSVNVEPELIVRESTGPAYVLSPAKVRKRSSSQERA